MGRARETEPAARICQADRLNPQRNAGRCGIKLSGSLKKEVIMHARSICLGLLFLAGCSYSVPVTGTVGSEPAQGQATAAMSGGTFSVSTARGLQCNGTYDALDTNPTITAPATCNDGRFGNLIITRSLDGLSGTVIGRLNDGTDARFVFGNLAFSQAAGGGTSQTIPVR
jgi:hypothetical protein